MNQSSIKNVYRASKNTSFIFRREEQGKDIARLLLTTSILMACAFADAKSEKELGEKKPAQKAAPTKSITAKPVKPVAAKAVAANVVATKFVTAKPVAAKPVASNLIAANIKSKPSSVRGLRIAQNSTGTTSTGGGAALPGAIPAGSSSSAASSSSSSEVQTTAMKTPEAKKEEKKLKGGFKMSIGAARNTDMTNKIDTMVRSSVGGRVSYHLTENLSFNVGVSAILVNGHQQVSEEKSAKPKNSTVGVGSANLTYDKDKKIIASGGVLPQNVHSSLVSPKSSFPAAKITLSNGLKEPKHVKLVGQAAIPTSYSLATNTTEAEKTPTMYSLALGGQIKFGESTTIKGQVSSYQFNDIPSAVAKESSDAGNQVRQLPGPKPDSPIYEFTTNFRGVEQQLGVEFDLSKTFSISLEEHYAKNMSAPDEMNAAWSGGIELGINVSDEMTLIPFYTKYSLQPDVTIASFNEYGTNITGYEAGLKIKLKKLFTVELSGSENDVIYLRPMQVYGRSYSVKLTSEEISF